MDDNLVKKNEKLLAYVQTLANKDTQGHIVVKELAAKTILLEQGEQGHFVYLIISGIVKCFITEDNDKNYTIEFMGAGEVFGELEIIKNTKSICTVKSLSPLSVFKIRADYFSHLMDHDRVFNKLIIEVLATRMEVGAKRAAFQQTYPAEHTVLSLLQLENDTIPKEELAEYLGITIRSLNRTILKLKEKGLLG